MKQNINFIKCFFLSVMCLGLFACSTASHHRAGDGNSYDEETIQSSGIDNERSFGKGSALKPGCNQIYYFDFDDSSVRDPDLASLEVQARYLSSHPRVIVRVEGNTDNRGSREYNIALGERRARSVADILRLNGADGGQIKIVSYGAEKAVAFGDSEEDHQLNRRVELIYER